MTNKSSFTRCERKILPDFRQKINDSKSTEDVKKFFSQTVRSLFAEVFAGEIDIDADAVMLTPDLQPGYRINKGLRSLPAFTSAWKDSDLRHILEKLVDTAIHRHRRLEKYAAKTEAKIRQ